MTTLPPCRHRGPESMPGVHGCFSPKLAGLKQVTAALCQTCYCRDHELDPRLPQPDRLLPCAHLGKLLSPRIEPVYECSHPAHRTTTDGKCRTCTDYLFPLITPRSPVADIQRIIELPPRQQVRGWWTWPNVQEAQRRSAEAYVEKIAPDSSHCTGRGIVMVGGGRYFPSAYVSICVLRHVGCHVPVELWHLNGEITPRMRELVGTLGVTLIDADAAAARQPFRFLEGHWWKGWQLKAYALANSAFEEVLLLDADCYPTRNPESIFTSAAYLRHGSIFWPDYPTSAGLMTPAQWQVFGLEPRQPPFESGQMLVHKGRCWRELQLTLWFNGQADYVYNHLWGDKDTYNLAWRQLRRDYGMLWPCAGWDTHTLLQYDERGEVLFQHRCRDKFRLSEEKFVNTPQNFAENTYNPHLAHEEFCFDVRAKLVRAFE